MPRAPSDVLEHDLPRARSDVLEHDRSPAALQIRASGGLLFNWQLQSPGIPTSNDIAIKVNNFESVITGFLTDDESSTDSPVPFGTHPDMRHEKIQLVMDAIIGVVSTGCRPDC